MCLGYEKKKTFRSSKRYFPHFHLLLERVITMNKPGPKPGDNLSLTGLGRDAWAFGRTKRSARGKGRVQGHSEVPWFDSEYG